MKAFASILLLLCMLIPCACAEESYFAQHGIGIDYDPAVDLNITFKDGILWGEKTAVSSAPWDASVRFVILRDETEGDVRNIEIGMSVTQLETLWLGRMSEMYTLTAFGAYDYYSGAQLDIGMKGYSMIDFADTNSGEYRCSDAHITLLPDGTEVSACMRWGIWLINDDYNPVYNCIFSFTVPAGYDGLVVACIKPDYDETGYSNLIENGTPELSAQGDSVHEAIFMRIQ